MSEKYSTLTLGLHSNSFALAKLRSVYTALNESFIMTSLIYMKNYHGTEKRNRS